MPRTRKVFLFLTLLVGISLTFGLFNSCHSNQGQKESSNDQADGGFDSVARMSVFKSSQVEMNYTLDSSLSREKTPSLKISYMFHDTTKPFIGFLVKDIGATQDWSGFDSVVFWSAIPKDAEDLKDLSIMLYQEDGSAYIAQFARKLTGTGWVKSVVPFSSFVYSSGGGFFKKKSDPLDLHKIRKIAVGIYQPVSFADKSFSINIAGVQPSRERGSETGGAASGNVVSKDDNAVVDRFDAKLSGWTVNVAKTLALDYSIDDQVRIKELKALKLHYRFKESKPFWGYAEKGLGSVRDWSGYDSLHLWTYIPTPAKDLVDLSVILYEEGGGAYIAQHARGLKSTGWEELSVPFSKFYPAGSWAKDDNGKLDLDRIKKVGIGIFQPNDFSDNDFVFYVADVRAAGSGSGKRVTMASSSAIVTRTNQLQKLEPADGKVYHGVFAFSAPAKGWGKKRSDWEEQIDTKQIEEYEKVSGKRTAIASFVWFLDWDFPVKLCERVHALGKIPHVGITSGAIKPTDIVEGKVDKKLAQWAAAAKGYGKPVFFRFFAEMNGNWNSYSEARDPAQTHQMYIAAWRHVVTAFRKAGATNVVWVWAPTAVDIGNIRWSDYYPGDDYVDWVGISVYSFLGDGDPEAQILGIYNDYAARKPVMISECGAGGTERDPRKYKPGNSYSDNPEKWIERFFDTMEKKAPRVKAFVWFNIDRERVWKIQESPAKATVFQKRVLNNRYVATPD